MNNIKRIVKVRLMHSHHRLLFLVDGVAFLSR